VPSGHAASPTNGQQQEWQQYRLFSAPPAPHLRPQLFERRPVDDHQVGLLFERVLAIRQQKFVVWRQPVLQLAPILFLFNL
jgi:hypothetical protein